MANKFYGKLGFNTGSVETPPSSGVWVMQIVERPYYGDILQNSRQTDEKTTVNPNLTVSNRISILADAYANETFFAIRYVEWMGSLWQVQNVLVQAPRLILTLGGVYNGPTAPASSEAPGPDA